MLSSAVHQPTELMYEHKSSWGGFLERNHRAAANNLSIRDVNLLKIAEKDIKKQHKAAVKTETTDKAAYKQEKLSEKLALLKKQKAKAKKAAVQAAIAKATSKAEPKAASVPSQKGLNLSKRDKQLLQIATKQIKEHHAQELAEETRDDDAEKVAKNKARAAYLAKHPRAVHTNSDKHVAAAAVKATKSAPAAVVVAAPVDTQMAATEKALQAVGVTGSALKLLASAEKSQTRDTNKGNAQRQRDTKAFIQMAKKNNPIFDDSKARAEAARENRQYAKEASIGLKKATEDDDSDYSRAWRQ